MCVFCISVELVCRCYVVLCMSHQKYQLPTEAVINTLQSLTPGRLHLKKNKQPICGQFDHDLLLVNTAVKTKWLKLRVTNLSQARLMGFPR